MRTETPTSNYRLGTDGKLYRQYEVILPVPSDNPRYEKRFPVWREVEVLDTR